MRYLIVPITYVKLLMMFKFKLNRVNKENRI